MPIKAGQAVGLGLVLGIVLLCGGPFFFLWLVLPGPGPLPPFARDLLGPFSEADRVFAERVRAAFPPGSNETGLIETLEAQGFSRPPSGGGRRMVFVQKGPSCRLTWSVEWTADRSGGIASIDPEYRGVCL